MYKYIKVAQSIIFYYGNIIHGTYWGTYLLPYTINISPRNMRYFSCISAKTFTPTLKTDVHVKHALRCY